MKRPILIYVMSAILAFVSCDRHIEPEPVLPGMFNVTFMDSNAPYQSVQETAAVDKLIIDVYESDTLAPLTYTYAVNNGVVEKGVDIPFKEGATYELYFWAQKGSGSVYSVKAGSLKDGATVKYPANFKADDLSTFDSYSASVKFCYPEGMPSEIKMKRNVAKIDYAFFKENLKESRVSQIDITLSGLADKITFTSDETPCEGQGRFRFEDKTSYFANNEDYNLDSRIVRLGAAYLPVQGSATVQVAMTMTDADGNKVGETVDEAMSVQAGMATALIYNGNEVLWKGLQSDALPTEAAKDGWIHISKISEFAALLAGGGQKGAKYHICNDMDMSLLPLSVAKDFDGTAVFEKVTIDGGIYDSDAVPSDYKVNPKGSIRILNLELPAASGLFGHVKNFEATNIIIEDAVIGSKSEKVDGTGAFIGKSYGTLSLKNVKVIDSKVYAPCRVGGLVGAIYGGEVTLNDCDLTSVNVSTIYKKGVSGQAGGLVGFIGRKSEKDRAEELDVTIFKCDLARCKVTAYMQSEELHSGRLVGTLSGYDRNEILSIVLSTADESTVLVPRGEGRDDNARALSGRYVNACKSAFCEDLPAEYEDLVGGQVYQRGVVRYGNYQVETQLKEFVPRWDGVTIVTPLKANSKYDDNVKSGDTNYVIYTAADLVGAREATDVPNALYLMNSVDMNGQGEDGEFNVPDYFEDSYYESDDDNLFIPFKRVKLLEGNGNTIYNMAICQYNAKSTAFILSASETTQHLNINFSNCCVIGTHTEVETNSTAQAAILCSNAGGKSYTADNVNAYDCKVFGVQKIGTLIANLSADDSNVKNCNVERAYIENYEVLIDEMFTGNFQFQDYGVVASKSFYPHGEVGGLIGFVSSNTTIEKCNVKDSEINCYGLDDVEADIIPNQAASILSVLGYYFVPGRHVSTFIGDIRTIDGETIQINNCKVDSKTKCTRRWDKYCWTTVSKVHKTYPYIGSCYYVAFMDTIGTVFVDGNRINLHDCRKTSACYEHNIN